MTDITLPELAAKLGWKIYDGSEYLWKCYGPTARFVYFKEHDADHSEWEISVIFDTKTLEVREITGNGTIWDLSQHNLWCWRDPNYQSAYLAECKVRNVQANNAWDDADYNQIVTVDELNSVIQLITFA